MVDVSEELHSLFRREGLNQWKVFTGDGSKEYTTYQQYREDIPIHSNNSTNKNTSYNKTDSNNNLNNTNSSKKRKMEQPNKPPKNISSDNHNDNNNTSSPPTTQNQNQNQRTMDLCESMFPPLSSEENISKQLKRCVRIYPHLQDSGGFFVAMLRKSIGNPNKKSNNNNNNSNNNNNKSNSVNKGKNKNSNNDNNINNNNTSTTKNNQQDNNLPNGVGEYSAKEMQIKQHRFPLNQRYSQSI